MKKDESSQNFFKNIFNRINSFPTAIKLIQESAIFLTRQLPEDKRQPGYYLQINDNKTGMIVSLLYIPITKLESEKVDLKMIMAGIQARAEFLFRHQGAKVASRQSLYERSPSSPPGSVLFGNYVFTVRGVYCREQAFGKKLIQDENDINEALAFLAGLYLCFNSKILAKLKWALDANQKLKELLKYLADNPIHYLRVIIKMYQGSLSLKDYIDPKSLRELGKNLARSEKSN